jgi:TPR repeat protein
VKLDFHFRHGPGGAIQNGAPPADWKDDEMLGVGEMTPEGVLPLPSPGSSGDELFRLGLLYSTGQGGAPLDYVSAHMLFNLAAMRGSQEAKIYRKELSREMDPGDVAEAQRQARQWLAEG